MFPNIIKEYINNIDYKVDNVGRSEDKVYIFEDKYVLKVSDNKQRLYNEKERIDFLNKCGIPGSKSICIIEENNKCYYLRTCINGKSLIDKEIKDNPILLVNILVNVISILRKLDNSGCPFKSYDSIGNDFVHGDLCLPNIYVDDKNEFAGFIDLDNAGLGDKWYDYSWLLWSLTYNLKTDRYNEILLNKLNLKLDVEKYNKYIPLESRKKIMMK